MKEIPSFVIGSGMASRALLAALDLVKPSEPDLRLEPRRLKRGEALPRVTGPSLLLIANPHALHAELVLEAQTQGFTHVVSEKPLVVNTEQVDRLREVRLDVSVCHGYRQNWGPRRIRQAIAQGELGKLVAIEGRYWQSSAAAHAVSGAPARSAWKNDAALSGPHDTLLDLGTHWADLACFLVGEMPRHSRGWLSYVNAEAPHRDTHVHLEMQFSNAVRAFGSVSKTVHGAGNHLEVVAIGSDAMMRWSFERPDELIVGRGKESRTFSRSNDEPVASSLPAHHALGWLEGYASILQQVVRKLAGKPADPVPTLKESLDIAEALLRMDIQSQR